MVNPIGNEDVAVVMAMLVAEGLVEQSKENEPGGFRITPVGYDKASKIWMAMSGENKILLAAFLRKVRLL